MPNNRFTPYYLAYIVSAAWRERRRRALELDGWRCQLCGCRNNLQVHHNNYEHLGCELDEDLAVLCDSCHKWATWFLRIRKLWRQIK